MSGVGGVSGSGPLYSDHLKIDSEWSDKPSGDKKKDFETVKNVIEDLISKLKNGNFNQSKEFPTLEKLVTLLNNMDNQYGATLPPKNRVELKLSIKGIDSAIQSLQMFGDRFLSDVQKSLEASLDFTNSIIQSLK